MKNTACMCMKLRERQNVRFQKAFSKSHAEFTCRQFFQQLPNIKLHALLCYEITPTPILYQQKIQPFARNVNFRSLIK